METMYPGKVNSPATTLDGGINNIVTTINIIDGSVLPVAPNIAVIGIGEDAETILYATKVVNVLSNITRGFQGVAKAWLSGETIARLFTEYDYASLKANINTIETRKISDFAEVTSAELAGKISDEIGTGKILLCEEGEWTPVIKFGGNSVGLTYDIRGGTYTKIGRQVTVIARITLANKGTSTGEATIEDLPFQNKNLAGSSTSVTLRLEKVTFANVAQGFLWQDGVKIYLEEITEAGVVTFLTDVNFANDSGVMINLTYFTN